GHRWVALVGTVWAQVGGHRWVALLGTGRWHFWAQVCEIAEWHTGGCTAGHRWVHCWAQVGGTCGWHCWAPIIRALIISALMIGAIPALTTAGSRQYFPHDLTA
ncbi:unnamed protein product, partial [Staurois parvus]